ncbi:MAG TPA: hypothetical protein VEL51_04015 [Vicinamibacterales bacterium]|nr:hypothetical protein [Vicinamibacterales bacterium]
MSDDKESDGGKGVPPGAEKVTAEPQAADPRLIPGGSFRAARTAIGMDAVDREDLPSGGRPILPTDYKDTPRTDAERPPHPPEPPTTTGH